MLSIVSLCRCLVSYGSYDLCFFFKQKTAYEMRISDWSSDVCSSDLRPEDAMAAQVRSVEQLLGVTLDANTLLDLAYRIESGLPEIGRASCRERVCQYV